MKEYRNLSRNVSKRIFWHVRPTKTQISLRIRAVLIVLGFNDRSILVGHFVSSPREREKRNRRDSRGDQRKG